MSTLIERGEVLDCSNTKLDIFITFNAIPVNPFDLEFAIFDIIVPSLPVQTFPVAGFFVLDPANDCPVGQRIALGHFTALWTVPVDEPLTNHKITWRFRLNMGDPQQEFEQPFNVLSAVGSQDPLNVTAFRCRFPAFADQAQFPAGLVTEVLDEAIACVDAECFGPDFTVRAQQYMAAHLLAYVTDGARAKGATSIRAGSAGITFSDAREGMKATAYGQRYLSLARKCAGGMVLC